MLALFALKPPGRQVGWPQRVPRLSRRESSAARSLRAASSATGWSAGSPVTATMVCGSSASTTVWPSSVADHDVARQQQADRGVGAQGPVGERRVAGAEDQVVLHLLAQLLAQRRLHVDLGQHAEALGLERIADARCGLGEGAGAEVAMIDAVARRASSPSGQAEEHLLHLLFSHRGVGVQRPGTGACRWPRS